MTLTVRTPALEIAYEAYGDGKGFPVVLLHGFPDDALAWDDVALPLAYRNDQFRIYQLRRPTP